MSEIHGSCRDQFVVVRNLLSDNVSSGADIGASVAVLIDGEPVVDIWGGHADEARTRPWERDTLTNVFSSTKPLTALCLLILANRRVIDLDAPALGKDSPMKGIENVSALARSRRIIAMAYESLGR
jgi:hypothetical protein